MAKNYRIVTTSLDSTWDSFVAASPDATVFMSSCYLKHTGCRLGLYSCYNSNELRAVIALVESPDGTSVVLDDLVVYSGICFGPTTSGQNRAQQMSERHELTSFIVKALSKKYRTIEFALAPSITDIRPFLWHNYGEVSNRFTVDVRYTSYLNIEDFAKADDFNNISAYKNATGARRQQIRYSRRDGVTTEEFHDVELFLEFYRKTMERQDININSDFLYRMAYLIRALLNNGSACMFMSRTNDGVAGSVAVYAHDTYRGYYLFGASDPDLRKTPTGTAVLWDAFYSLAKQGVKEIDLEGVNSPQRGWFKLSFGGSLIPYFQVRKQ